MLNINFKVWNGIQDKNGIQVFKNLQIDNLVNFTHRGDAELHNTFCLSVQMTDRERYLKPRSEM